MTKLPVLQEKESPWYKKGLRFKCTECGKCCTGKPGYVWVTKEEIVKIAAHLNMPLDLFMRKHIRMEDNRYALREIKRENFDCIFLQGKRCQIYEVRPIQCRTYPWWPENLSSEEAWRQTASDCEGIRDDASVVPYEHIESNLQEQHQSREQW